MRLRFDKLRVIMPSGLEVNFPENAELPSLDIKQAFATSGGSFPDCRYPEAQRAGRYNS